MTVSKVINQAVSILGDDGLLKYLNGDLSLHETYKSDKDMLTSAYNQAMRSVATYFPLLAKENFVSENGKVKYERFAFNPYKIKSVKVNSVNGDYKILPTEIIVDGEITVEYYYFPYAESFEDRYVYDGVIPVVEISYGVLAEYLLYKGRYSESATYLDKFITALKNYSRANKSSVIRAREWF